MSGKPMRNVAAFFHTRPFEMYAKNMANMRNPMRAYIPEHAISTAKVKGGLLAFSRMITGVSYCSARLTGKPVAFRIACAAWELVVDMVEPRA